MPPFGEREGSTEDISFSALAKDGVNWKNYVGLIDDKSNADNTLFSREEKLTAPAQILEIYRPAPRDFFLDCVPGGSQTLDSERYGEVARFFAAAFSLVFLSGPTDAQDDSRPE